MMSHLSYLDMRFTEGVVQLTLPLAFTGFQVSKEGKGYLKWVCLHYTIAVPHVHWTI